MLSRRHAFVTALLRTCFAMVSSSAYLAGRVGALANDGARSVALDVHVEVVVVGLVVVGRQHVVK